VSTVRRNTIANYAGQAWSALVSLAFVPVYIAYVGIEAYGIIGFFVALQSLFTLLDLGLSAALNRELARRSQSSPAGETRDLVRTLEWIYWPIGMAIVLAVWLAARPLAEHWLRTVSIPVDRAAEALMLLGVAAALQWPVSFYTGGLSGLQRQVLLNVLSAVFATLRALGAVGVLALVSPTLEAFLYWQIALSAAQSVCFAWVMWRVLPRASAPARFSAALLRSIGGFAAGITGVTLLSFLLTQTDRILLSKILALDQFGVYALASSAALALGRLVYPIVNAVYPRYSQLVAAGNGVALVDFYHRTNQAIAAIVLPVAAIAVLFAKDILWLWTRNPAIAAGAAPVLALLVAGTAVNGLMNLPYALQLAYGWIRLSFWTNVVAVCFVVPAIWIAGTRFGGVGAAAAWLALNLGYLAVGIPLMHRRLMTGEMWRWYLADVLPPLAAAALVAALWRLVLPDLLGFTGLALLLGATATTLAAGVAAAPFPRSVARAWWSARRGAPIAHG